MLKGASLAGSAGFVLCVLARLIGLRSLGLVVAGFVCVAVSITGRLAWNITNPENDRDSMQRGPILPLE